MENVFTDEGKFSSPKFVEMFNFRIAKFMVCNWRTDLRPAKPFYRNAGGIDRFPWNDKLRSREFPCALQDALSGEETNDR